MTAPTDPAFDAFRESLLEVAPEADLAALRPDAPLRRQLDIDSFDFLRMLEVFQARTGIDVPERDYARLDTLEGVRQYLAEREAPA